jgi:hypothetical protein|tara:strand:- start:3679 stop:3906 length:228 start_codon:yes stop_codon:yes gene_type:complete
MGPVTVNPSKCRNTASITHPTLAFLRHAGREFGREEEEDAAVEEASSARVDASPAALFPGRCEVLLARCDGVPKQ